MVIVCLLGWPLFIVGMTVFRGGALFIVVIVCLLGWPLLIVGMAVC